MEDLEIDGPVKDASVLEELKNLKKIKLSKWNVKDLVVLSSCAGLEEINLQNIQGFESDFDCSGLLKDSKAQIKLNLDAIKFERFPVAITTFSSITYLSLRDCKTYPLKLDSNQFRSGCGIVSQKSGNAQRSK
ncbi:hypothetical protein LEP1GSC168_0825 [Leptospira santarosai str. HAI134]|nr:hypothetical protein LEP1GSC168_0825 [Leptospira santarosai str. HAI134]